MEAKETLHAIFGVQLAPEDIKWLTLVRDNEIHGREPRPLPAAFQTRLHGLGLIELRHHKLVLTALGIKALKEALDS